jgi:PadR family transcriptional regulator PadR
MPADSRPSDIVQGTLQMLILKTLALEPLHGYGIGVRLEQISRGAFRVNAGSLFPALRRLERDGLIKGDWRVTENNRRAKYYILTPLGRAQLKRETRDWEHRRPRSPGFSGHRWESCDGAIPAAHRQVEGPVS